MLAIWRARLLYRPPGQFPGGWHVKYRLEKFPEDVAGSVKRALKSMDAGSAGDILNPEGGGPRGAVWPLHATGSAVQPSV